MAIKVSGTDGVGVMEYVDETANVFKRPSNTQGFPVAGSVVVASAEITAASGVSAYAANDVISAAAAPATFTTPTALTLATRNGQNLLLTKIRVITNNVATLVNFRLAVYTSNPTGANAIPLDNALWTMLYANATTRQATIEMPIATTGGSGSDSAASMYVGAPIPVKCGASTKQLHFVLIAGAGFTPAANQKYTIEVTAQSVD